MGPYYSVGSIEGVPFTVHTSGSEIAILDGNFKEIQKLTCPDPISSIDCSTDVGKIAATYQSQIIIFEPTTQSSQATGPEWTQSAILDSPEPITVISFNIEGSRIITGGKILQLYVLNASNNSWQCVWSCQTATSISFLKYSPDGSIFCSAGPEDRFIKVWYEIDTNFKFGFVYLVHPWPVTSVEWRRTSKYCPKGSVANVLLSSCEDNKLRVWIQTSPLFSLYLGAILEPDSSITGQQFVAHWLNTKEILVDRSIEVLLHDVLLKILKARQGSEQPEGEPDNTIESGIVEEFDKTLNLLLKKWQISTDVIVNINKLDGSLTMWQIKYLDGEDLAVVRQVQIERLGCTKSALPFYDATTMSLNITAYSPSAYLEVKRAYRAVTGSSKQEQLSPSDVMDILSRNNNVDRTKHTISSVIESEPSIYIVTQHLNGILGLWKLNFTLFPNVQSVDPVTRITGLRMDPSWLEDGVLTVEFDESILITEWQTELQQQQPADGLRDFYRASDLANISILPEYHTKQLVDLMSFGQLQQVKDVLNRLVSPQCDDLENTRFNPDRAKSLAELLSRTQLPGLTNVDQMQLLAIADTIALFEATPEELFEMDTDPSSQHIAIDSLDDRGQKYLIAVRQHNYLVKCLPIKQRAEIKAAGIRSHNFIWAFHSDTQDELINFIPSLQRDKTEWSDLREFGIGWWVKKLEVVKKLIGKVAQSAFQARQEPLDAALFYLAMKKKTLVCALLRRVSGSDKRLLKLFEQDFSDPINRKKALKNAYALLGKHRFEHAAAFFILAGSIWDAVEVCINNLKDIQLAIILIRLYDGDASSENLKRLLTREIPGMDAFLRSIAYWLLGDHMAAINTLHEGDLSETRASRFNLHLYLRSHPLVKNRHIEDAEDENEKIDELCFSTASAYLESGCPLLALEVLSRLDTGQAIRMKFKARLLVILNQLKSLAPEIELTDWFKSSMRSLQEICTTRKLAIDELAADSDDSRQLQPLDEEPDSANDASQVAWIKRNEPILRTMLTFCNLHSATENSLIKIRMELIGLLNKLQNKASD